MKKKLKLNKKIFYPVSSPYITNNDKDNINRSLKSGWISSNGPEIIKFEKKFSNFVSRKYSIAVSSGTAALEIAIKALGIKKNDEVLIPTLNFPATSNVAIYCGAIPHFIDVEEKTLGINYEKLDKYLKDIAVKKGKYFYNKKTKRRIKALIPTHIFGHSGNLKDLTKVRLIKFIFEKATIYCDENETLYKIKIYKSFKNRFNEHTLEVPKIDLTEPLNNLAYYILKTLNKKKRIIFNDNFNLSITKLMVLLDKK